METELTKLITRDSRVCHFSGVVPLWMMNKSKYSGNELAIYIYLLTAHLNEKWSTAKYVHIKVSHAQWQTALGQDVKKAVHKIRCNRECMATRGRRIIRLKKSTETMGWQVNTNNNHLNKWLLEHPYLAVNIGTNTDKLEAATSIQDAIKLCTWSNFNGSIALAVQAKCRLSGTELAIFLDLLIEHLSKCSYPVVFNWNIKRDTKRYAVLLKRSTQYVSRSILKLVDHGLISKAERGTYTVQDSKVAAIYREWMPANTELI